MIKKTDTTTSNLGTHIDLAKRLANEERLQACESLHDFVAIGDGKHQCERCGGVLNREQMFWYQRGLLDHWIYGQSFAGERHRTDWRTVLVIFVMHLWTAAVATIGTWMICQRHFEQ